MSYCTRIAELSWGADSPLNFLCIKTASQSWCSTISLTQPSAIENYLNSLGIGIFTVESIENGLTVTTECNAVEFTQITFTTSAGDQTANFTDDDCSDLPCAECETNCLDGLVGLRDVCTPSDSCIMMNELGISRYTIEQIYTKDYAGPEDFFNKQYKSALEEVASAIHSNFSEKYISKSILEGNRLGFEQDNLSVKAANNKKSGIYIELPNTNSYINLVISELSLFTDYTGAVSVNVYDIVEGRRIDVISVPCVAGQRSTVSINKIYKSKRKWLKLLLAYDTTGINSYKTLIKNGICCGQTTCSNNYLTAGGYYSYNNIFTRSDLKASDHTFGMSLVYSLQCNHQDWLCSHKGVINLPVAYRLAANITNFGLNVSPQQRVNTTITINKEELRENLAFYEGKYTERMSQVLSNMHLPSDAKCFQCASSNRTVLNLP